MKSLREVFIQKNRNFYKRYNKNLRLAYREFAPTLGSAPSDQLEKDIPRPPLVSVAIALRSH